LRQITHFGCHHRKTSSLLTGTGRFNGSIQRQNIGLEGNAINDANIDDFFELSLIDDIVCTTYHNLSATHRHLRCSNCRIA
jgi:hypothetical protein